MAKAIEFLAKRKLVTNISKICSLEKGCDLHCSKVAREDFGSVGALTCIEIIWNVI
jgi:hypothetical protein